METLFYFFYAGILYEFGTISGEVGIEAPFGKRGHSTNQRLACNGNDFEAVNVEDDVDLVKKATCNSVDLQNNKQYLVMGSSGSEVTHGGSSKYRLPLDSEALVELWPTECSSPECRDYSSHMTTYAVDLQLYGCP